MILLAILLVISIALNKYLYGKWKEFESLFELSKSYEPSIDITDYAKCELKIEITDNRKRNKDSSIAKKRGRKSNVKTT